MSISHLYPSTRPSLNLNFARSQKLDPRITFTRTTSGTRVGPDGYIEVIPADQPRFDFDPVTGECLGLLIEEQRVNNYHIWNSTTDTSSSINPAYIDTQTVSSVLTPRGLPATAYTATKTGNTNQYHGLGGGANSFSINSNTSISASAYIKDFNNSDYRLLFVISAYNATTNNNRYILYTAVPSTGTWQTGFTDGRWTVTSNVKDVGNGWYRFEISGTNTYEAGWDTINFSFQLLNESNQQFYDPPTANTHGLYLSSPQWELGSFPTSYIPTNNANGTRTADNAKIDGENFTEWFNNNEFSIFTHHKFPQLPPNYYPRVFDINNGNDANRINHYHDPSIYGTKIGSSVVENNVAQSALSTSAYTIGDDIRMASCFKDNDFASYVNGTLVGTDNSGVFTTTQRNVLYIGSSVNGSFPINGTISQLTYYPVRLPNQILQNLTK